MLIIGGILLFMLLVMIHELGHFWAAKKSGVKVHEFGIGIPPKVCTLRKDKSGTEYTLNLIPLGGFVRLKGEDPNHAEDFKAKDSFITQNFWKKAIILLGGVTMNTIFAWIIFTIVFWRGTDPITILPENMMAGENQSYLMATEDFLTKKGFISGSREGIEAKIIQILPGGIASNLGLQSGDVITKIGDYRVNSITLSKTLKKYIGQTFPIEYTRDGKSMSVSATCEEEHCVLGVMINQQSNREVKPIKFGLFGAMGAAWSEICAQSKLTFSALGTLGKKLFSFNGQKTTQALNQMSGPVGAIKMGELIYNDGGIRKFLAFGAMISLALALFNVLPIPALDGGRLLGVIIQTLTKVKPEKYFVIEGYFNFVFFVLLMGLGVYIIFKDLVVMRGVNIPFLTF